MIIRGILRVNITLANREIFKDSIDEHITMDERMMEWIYCAF